MAVTADSVIIELEAKLDKFQRDTATAAGSFDAKMGLIAKSAGKAELGIQKAAAGIGTLKAAVLGFVAAISVDKVIQLAGASLDYAANLGETAQQAGVTTKTLQELSFAATQANVEQGQLEAGLAKLTRTLGEAKAGSEKQVAAFKAVGISAKELQNLNTDEAFRRIADALSKIEDPAKRAAIEVDLFGKAGQKLDTLLAGGTTALNEFADAAREAGAVLSDEQIANADKAADKLAAVQKVLSANIAGVVADNANAIFLLADAITRAANAAGRGITGLNDYLTGLQEVSRKSGGGEFGLNLDRLRAAFDPSGTADRGAVLRFSRGLQLGGPGILSNGRQQNGGAFLPDDTADAAKKTGGGRAGKRELTPAEQRLAFMSPGNAGDFSGLSDAQGKVKETSLELDNIFGKFEALQTVAVDLSNVEIIDQQAIDAAAQFSKNLSDGLAFAIINGQNLGDALVNSIKAAAAELISSGLLKLLSGGDGGGLIGGIAKGLGSIFGGGFANGGRPPTKRVSLVGERGPELFVPDGAGTVIPNNRIGGGTSIVQNINVSLAGNAATKEDAAMFARIAYEQSISAFVQSQQLGIPTL